MQKHNFSIETDITNYSHIIIKATFSVSLPFLGAVPRRKKNAHYWVTLAPTLQDPKTKAALI